jgi:hypothetical protein
VAEAWSEIHSELVNSLSSTNIVKKGLCNYNFKTFSGFEWYK